MFLFLDHFALSFESALFWGYSGVIKGRHGYIKVRHNFMISLYASVCINVIVFFFLTLALVLQCILWATNMRLSDNILEEQKIFNRFSLSYNIRYVKSWTFYNGAEKMKRAVSDKVTSLDAPKPKHFSISIQANHRGQFEQTSRATWICLWRTV